MVAFPKALIRIIAIPPGEAPLEIREQWVGLILPLVEDEACAWEMETFGILTGKIESETTIGYAVGLHEAMAALGEKSPEAVAWWRTNAPHLFEEDSVLVFDQVACRLISC
jgi:hypothetical protein